MTEWDFTKITVLSGGHGGAKFIQGLLHGIRTRQLLGVSPDAEVTVVANTADDLWIHGVKVCPDLDTVMYTLGDGLDHERGWGRTDETWSVKEELATYGVEGSWFGLGDRDIATHLVRTQMLEAGYPLSQVTAALCDRWLTPVHGDAVTLLPMTDDRVETHVVISDPAEPSGRRVVHFQEYWVRLRAQPPVEQLLVVGLDESTAAPGVLAAISDADLVLVPPSNPIVSVGTILGVPGVREAVVSTKAPVVGFSPIIAGHHVRGMAEQLLSAAGIEVSATGVGTHYGARGSGGVLDHWVVDASEQPTDLQRLGDAGLGWSATSIWMTTPQHTTDFLQVALADTTDR